MNWKVGRNDEGTRYEYAIGASGMEYSIIAMRGGTAELERISEGGGQCGVTHHRSTSDARDAAEREERRDQAERSSEAAERKD